MQRKIKGKGQVVSPHRKPTTSKNHLPTSKGLTSLLKTEPYPLLPTPETPNKSAPKPMDAKRCFRCHSLSHIASTCPNKRVVTLAEKYQVVWESMEETEEKGNKELLLTEEIEEYKEGSDEGEILIVRRALSGLVALENQEQTEAIFYTRCTIGGKVCSLIIDGGSCTSVASKTRWINSRFLLYPIPHFTPFSG